MKIEPVTAFEVLDISAMITQHFLKRNNQQMRVIIYFRGLEEFLKIPVIIIIPFGENEFEQIHIDMYQFRGWAGWVHGLPYISSLLFIKTKIKI